MPVHRVTAKAQACISEWKSQGRSSRDIASALLNEHGIQLDQRTISRVARSIAPHRSPIATEAPKATRPDPPTVGSGASVAHLLAEGETLDEVSTLEAQAVALHALLATDLPPRDWAALNAELRQTFRAISKAKRDLREAKQAEHSDVAWMVAKLKRFAAQRATPAPANDVDTLPVPSERDSASG